jgi:hypothetical protein
MTRLLTCAALALFAVACGAPEPPRHYSIDVEFSASERATIHAAVDAWCESDARSCPEEIGWAERGRFVLVDDLPEPAETISACTQGRKCTVSANNNGTSVEIARNRTAPDDLGFLFTIGLHEWGHFCIDGHPVSGGLMAAVHRDDEGALSVDDEAVRAWKDGCAVE